MALPPTTAGGDGTTRITTTSKAHPTFPHPTQPSTIWEGLIKMVF